jgi:hypothetical protein
MQRKKSGNTKKWKMESEMGRVEEVALIPILKIN